MGTDTPTATRAVASKQYSLVGFLVFTWGWWLRVRFFAQRHLRWSRLKKPDLVFVNGNEIERTLIGVGFAAGRLRLWEAESFLTESRIGNAVRSEQVALLMKFHQEDCAFVRSVFTPRRFKAEFTPLHSIRCSGTQTRDGNGRLFATDDGVFSNWIRSRNALVVISKAAVVNIGPRTDADSMETDKTK